MKRRFPSLRVRAWPAPRAYWVLGVLAVLFAAGGEVPALEALAVACAALALAAFVVDCAIVPGTSTLTVERLEPDPLSLRRPARLRYRVRNGSSRPSRIGIIEPQSELLRFGEDEFVTVAPAGTESLLERSVTPVARGTTHFGELFFWTESSLALVRCRRTATGGQELRVYPDLSAVERYGTLHARNRLVEAGVRRQRLRGSGSELESVREWTDGDAFRSVNWKATAHRGNLMVTQYEVERSQNVMILLDAGRLMTPRVDEQRKFDYAVTAALSVASVAALSNDKVGIVAFAGEILRARAPRSSGLSLARLAEEIHDLEPRFEESDYAQAFAYVRSRVSKRSLVVFFTDMVDPVAQSTVLAQIQTLCRRHLVVCAFMNDAAIDAALDAQPRTTTDVYAASVALELREERRTAAAVLRRMGVRAIDVPARQLTTALIDRYLQIKTQGAL